MMAKRMAPVHIHIKKIISTGRGCDPYGKIDIDRLISTNELLNDIELNHIDSSDIEDKVICDLCILT